MRITLPRGLRRLWIKAMTLESVADVISPEYHEEPIADDTPLLRGLSEIHRAKADNLAYFAEHKPHGYAFTFGKKE